MDTDLIICKCYSINHQIIIAYEKEDEESNERYAYLYIHLNKLPFFSRIKYAFKYILGYQCKYGAFDEIILAKDSVENFEKLVNFLKSE